MKIPGADVSVAEGKKITKAHVDAMRKAGIETIDITEEAMEGAFAAADIVDPGTGEVLLEANEEMTARIVSLAHEKGVEAIDIFFPERDEIGTILSTTLRKDPIRTHEEALIEIYRRLRPATRRRSTARARCSRTCSSTRRSTTSRGSAGSSSTPSSG